MPKSSQCQHSKDGEAVVHANLDSSAPAVSAVLAEVCQHLQSLGLTAEDLSTTELVLAEVLNNIVEHAYQNQPGNQVELWVRMKGDCLECKVVDTGISLQSGALPPGILPDMSGDLDSLPEGGFGWFLIKELTDGLTYEKSDGHNDLRFIIKTTPG